LSINEAQNRQKTPAAIIIVYLEVENSQDTFSNRDYFLSLK